jgi:HK97 family phage portal protein
VIISNGSTLDFAPQALGETVPSIASGYFYGQQGLDLSGQFATYAKLYKSQPAIATVVDKVANSAARLSIRVFDTTDPVGRTMDAESPLAKLMERPNSKMSPYSFWRWTFSTLDIYGEAFWYKQRDSFGAVVDLIPMHPSRVAVKRDPEGKITYIFTLGVASAGLLTVADTEVVAFMRYNPETLMRGMSRLEPLRSTLLNEDAARRATASWWKRGARPSVILKHPGNLSQNAQDRLKASFDARHSGADLMGGTAVLEEGMEAQVVQLSAEEMQYIESRKLNLQEVCMVFDVPPPVVHILDHATYSNITEQMRSMYRDTMAPRLEEIESVIDSQLRTEFYGSGERIVKFALDEVLRGDFETRAQATIGLVTNGVMKPSEARPLFDLPALGEEADILYANGGLVPLGSGAQPPAPPVDPSAGGVEPSDNLGATKSVELKFNEDQPRDESGRFGSGDGGSAKSSLAAMSTIAKEKFKQVAYADLPSTVGTASPAVIDAMFNYGNYGYMWMNNSLRSGIFDESARDLLANAVTEENGQQQIKELTDALNAQQTELAVSVARWQYGMPGEGQLTTPVSRMTDDEIAGMVGNSFTAKGFTSTSATDGLNEGFVNERDSKSDIRMNIMLPEGTRGGTIGNKLEQEYILPPNTTFTVVGVSERDAGGRISMDLLVTGQEQ